MALYPGPLGGPFGAKGITPLRGSRLILFIISVSYQLLIMSCSHRPPLDQNTLLFRAVGVGDLVQIQALLKKGAQAEQKSVDGVTPLMLAARKSSEQTQEILNLLHSHGASLEHVDRHTMSVYHYASLGKNPLAVRWLAQHGVSPDVYDQFAVTPLMLALRVADLATIQALVEDAKADVSLQDPQGWEGLHFAILRGNVEIFDYLLSVKIKHAPQISSWINMRDAEGNTLLHYAVEYMAIPMVCRLRKIGARINIKNPEGVTPKDLAIKSNHPDVLKCLNG